MTPRLIRSNVTLELRFNTSATIQQMRDAVAWVQRDLIDGVHLDRAHECALEPGDLEVCLNTSITLTLYTTKRNAQDAIEATRAAHRGATLGRFQRAHGVQAVFLTEGSLAPLTSARTRRPRA